MAFLLNELFIYWTIVAILGIDQVAGKPGGQKAGMPGGYKAGKL